jgi:hypothetical protein
MLHEVAVDPNVMAVFENCRFIYGNCGVSKGRLISLYPRKWKKKVHEEARAFDANSEMKLKRVVEMLNKIDSKTIERRGESFDPTKPWIENAEESHEKKPFKAIVANKSRPGTAPVINGFDMTGDEDCWHVEIDQSIPRKTIEMGKAAEPLLKISKEIIFVDQNFNLEERFINPLKIFITHACKGESLIRMGLHLGFKYQSPNESAFKNTLHRLSGKVAENLGNNTLEVIRWNTFESEDNLHARYILTDKGGMKYDYGLDEKSNSRETTDVSLLDETLYNKRREQYSLDSKILHLHDAWIVTSSNVRKAKVQDGRLVAVE